MTATGQELTTMNGAFGLTFGMSVDSASTVMNQKGGTEILKGETILVHIGINFAGRSNATSTLVFDNNMLGIISFEFTPELTAKTQQYFDELKNDLSVKYGDPVCIRKFTGIYKDGDGYEMQAVKKGNGTIFCEWSFAFGNRIKIYIDESLKVNLMYINQESANEMNRKSKQKESTDL